MGITEVVTGYPAPKQNAFAERLVGSIRRECLDHFVVWNERHVHRILTSYFRYYHQARTHLSLDKDAPDSRPVHLPAQGPVVVIPEVAGLHHRYVRRLAA